MLGVAGWALVRVLETSLEDAKDDLSRARATELADQVREGTLSSDLVDLGEDGVAQVVDAEGKVLAASSGLQGSGPIVTVDDVGSEPRLLVLEGVQDDDETEELPHLGAARRRARTARSRSSSATAWSRWTRRRGALRRGLLVGVPLLVGLMAAGTWVIVSRSLRPVERIRAEVATISDTDLARRVRCRRPATSWSGSP